MFYVNVLQNGLFELIDGEFASLYPNLDFERMPTLDENQYYQWQRQNHRNPRWQNGKIEYDAEAERDPAAELSAAKAAKQTQAATAAQAFVNAASDVDNVPDFELQTWPLQSAEALAWGDNNSAATPMLDTIAAARNIDRVALIKKALKKARAYRLLTAHVAGQRQAIEAAINAAANLDALDAVHIAYTLPDAGDTDGDTGDVAPS